MPECICNYHYQPIHVKNRAVQGFNLQLTPRILSQLNICFIFVSLCLLDEDTNHLLVNTYTK